MKILQTTIGILSLSLIIIFSSCMNEKRKDGTDKTKLSVSDNSDDTNTAQTDASLDTYLKMKDALVNEDNETAAKAGGELANQFNDFNTESFGQKDQQELKKIIVDATEHAKYISENTIVLQREHFDMLSKNMIDIIGITGTSKKLYQAYCPMYNNDKGAQWLSASKEIRNPYFGDVMMQCGEVQKEIN